jgi:hypothetical protein
VVAELGRPRSRGFEAHRHEVRQALAPLARPGRLPWPLLLPRRLRHLAAGAGVAALVRQDRARA